MIESKWSLGWGALACGLWLAGCGGSDDGPGSAGPEGDPGESGDPGEGGEAPVASYQVWATDQGLSRILVWEPSGDGTFENVATIDYVALFPEGSAAAPRTPHMVDFSLDGRYAFVAHTSSGHTTVVRTADYEVIDILDTGPGSHMARVSPTGRVYVDVIGNAEHPGRVLELEVDLDAETFAVGRTLVIADDPAFDAGVHPSSSPVCGVSNADDSMQFVSFGPGFGGAMLARIDNASFSIDHIYDPTALRVNCGTIVGPNGDLYFTGGAAATTEAAGVGVWYVLDGQTYEPIPVAGTGEIERSTGGTDAHGLAFTADGSELWMLNRDSSNVTIFDGQTLEQIADVDDLFESPDILDISADGRFFFVTLRGPNPRSGPHSIAGTTPGLAVVDIAERRVVAMLVGDNDDPDESDYHGVRVLRR